MRALRSRWVLGLVLWTLAMLVVATVLAVGAIGMLYAAQQECFFDTTVPCPDGQDWRVGLLTFAFFGVPLIWLVGFVLAVVGRSVTKRRRERRPSPPAER
jgi:hypothetical protein